MARFLKTINKEQELYSEIACRSTSNKPTAKQCDWCGASTLIGAEVHAPVLYTYFVAGRGATFYYGGRFCCVADMRSYHS